MASWMPPKPMASAAPAFTMDAKLVFIEVPACFTFFSIPSTLPLTFWMVLVKPASVAPKSTLIPDMV